MQEKSQKASAIRSRNKYNHRLSRKGYAGLIAEMVWNLLLMLTFLLLMLTFLLLCFLTFAL